MIRVKRGTIRCEGVDYTPGKILNGLSEEEEARLVSKGVAEVDESAVAIPPKQPDPSKSNHDSEISNLNSKNAIAFAKSINSIEELEKLFKEETEGKNRASVISAIQGRASQLDEEDEDDTDNPDKEDPENTLNLNLKPEDMIVS